MSFVEESDEQVAEVVYSPEMHDNDLRNLLKGIGAEISEAIRRDKQSDRNVPSPPLPQPTKHRLETWQIVLGLIVSGFVIIAGLWAGLDYIVTSAITKALIPTGSDLATLKADGVGLRRDVNRLLDRSSLNIIKNPAAPATDLKDAANHLQQRQIEAPLQEVVSTGQTLVASGQPTPEQWQAFLAVVGYRTFLNVIPQAALTAGPLPPGKTWHYDVDLIAGKPAPQFRFSQSIGVPNQQAAQFDRIGVDHNGDLAQGPLLLRAIGGALSLDDWHARNVVFENVEIHYTGKPITLDNAIFVNCTFVMDNTVPARRLGAEMLASAAISFQNKA